MKKRNPFNLHEVQTHAFTEATKLNKDEGQINNVCMLRSLSLNNRYYTPEALQSLVDLGKDGPIKSFIDHDNFLQGQSVLKLLGEFSNLRKHEDAVFADMTVFKSSPGYGMLFDLAENHPHAAGFSINARGSFSDKTDAEGREVVERIVAIRSCDFVGEPATTHGVFESEDIYYEYATLPDANVEWTQSFINDLPDSAFAWIEDGGNPNTAPNGITRTFPLSLRHLPYKGKDGQISKEMTGCALEALQSVKNMTVEQRALVQSKLELILEDSERPVGEPYSMSNPPSAVKNLPAGAQKVFIDVFNRTLSETGDETKARMAAWGAVKNVYTRTASGTWVKKSKDSKEAGGDTDMSILIHYFGKKIDKFDSLSEEGQQSAIVEFVDMLNEKASKVPELEQSVVKLTEQVKSTDVKIAELQAALTEAQAKVDAYNTVEKERKERTDRIELIAKITKEEDIADEHVSEEFKRILMEVQTRGEETAEVRIRNLVKDRKLLLQATGVTGMGDEQKPDVNTQEKKDEKSMEDFFKELNEGL